MDKPTIELIPLSKLKLASEAPTGIGVDQPRKTWDQPAYAALRDNIQAIGQIVPLVVKRHDGFAYVVAGNRRLAVQRELAPTGIDVLIQAIDVASLKGEAAEVALADNIIRSPLHPVDKFEAFAGLVANGQTVPDIAARFSVKPREVEQSLAIAALAPEIREAWRAGTLDAAHAQMFTMERDQKRQVSIFKKLLKGEVQKWNLRGAIVGEGGRGDGQRLLRFVGTEAYEAAGGTVMVDLFQANHAVSDAALLKACADQKVADVCAGLLIEGWSFAIPEDQATSRYSWKREYVDGKPTKDEASRIKTIAKRLNKLRDVLNSDEVPFDTTEDALNDEIETLESEDETIKAAADARAWTPELRAKCGCVVSISHKGDLDVARGYIRPKAGKGAEPADRASPGAKKKAAKDRAKKAEKGVVLNALQQRIDVQVKRATKDALMLEAKGFASQPSKLPAALCELVAGLIKPDVRWNSALDEKQMEAIRSAISPATILQCLRNRFDAKDYFASVPKANVIAAVAEAVNADEARKLGSKKTVECQKFATDNVPQTGWLPVKMRPPHYVLTPPAGAAKPKPVATRKKGKR